LIPSASDGTDDMVYVLVPGASWVESLDPHTNMTPFQSPAYNTAQH